MTMMHSSHICDPCQVEPPREGHRPPAIKVTYLIRIQSAAEGVADAALDEDLFPSHVRPFSSEEIFLRFAQTEEKGGKVARFLL